MCYYFYISNTHILYADIVFLLHHKYFLKVSFLNIDLKDYGNYLISAS